MVTSCKIEKIEVIKLFGHYNYRLFLNKNTDNKFLILYGDNGCGKSTVLNLAFHLLAPEKGEGHKTAIAKIPFKSFSIDLSNGVSIVVITPARDSYSATSRNALHGAHPLAGRDRKTGKVCHFLFME